MLIYVLFTLHILHFQSCLSSRIAAECHGYQRDMVISALRHISTWSRLALDATAWVRRNHYDPGGLVQTFFETNDRRLIRNVYTRFQAVKFEADRSPGLASQPSRSRVMIRCEHSNIICESDADILEVDMLRNEITLVLIHHLDLSVPN